MTKIEDCYFKNYSDALELALEKNYYGAYNYLQLCYYDGKEENNNLPNLLNLPVDKVEDYLFKLETRPPTKILHPNKKSIEESLKNYSFNKIEKFENLKKIIKSKKLNFNEKLRVYISSENGGKIVTNTYHFLSKLFKNENFEVFFDENNETTIMDDYRRAKAIEKFNPHITININRLRNDFINDDAFNFIWFMDPTLILFDDSKLNLRKRDFIFYIGDEIKEALIKKNISKNKMFLQYLTPDYDYFYEIHGQTKENKIVFIGQNYFEVVEPTKYYKNHPVVEELIELFNKNLISQEKLDELNKKYKSTLKRDEHLKTFILPAVVRQEVVKWMCSLNNLKAEIYGDGWNNIQSTKKYAKGIIKSTKKLNEILNNSKYSLVVHSNYIYIPKLFESCAADSIPVVYQGNTTLDELKHKNSVLTFSHKKGFFDCFNSHKNINPKNISDEISTKTIVKKIKNIIKETINE